MRKISFITLIVMAVAASSLAVPVTDDLWDVSQGTIVTHNSPVHSDSDIRNLFGAVEGYTELGTTLFSDSYSSAGAEIFVEWKTTADVTLGSFKLYAAHDGPGGTYLGRSFDHFALLAKNPGTGVFTEIYSTDVAVPYTYINGEAGFLIEHIFSAAITAQEFKAMFRQHTNISWASGPRVYELDGFAVPEPATISLLSIGIFALRRRAGKY